MLLVDEIGFDLIIQRSYAHPVLVLVPGVVVVATGCAGARLIYLGINTMKRPWRMSWRNLLDTTFSEIMTTGQS